MMNENRPDSDAACTQDCRLPDNLRPFFWDCTFDELDFIDDQDFVIGRILSDGDFNALRWLRRKVGDDGLRDWFVCRQGRSLTLKQLRFWELILMLPPAEVDRWIAERHGIGWDDRVRK